MLENGRMKVPVGIIIHTRQHLNNALAQDRYFFVDVARDGIALYQDDDKPLPRPRPRTAASELEMAREYFDERFACAGAFRSEEHTHELQRLMRISHASFS